MGTCPSAHGACERGSPGGGGAQAAPAYGQGRIRNRGTTGTTHLTNGGAHQEEDLEAQAAPRTLLSGVQRWCLDVSEWGELSAEQVS